jgi:hypothetical protein
MIVFGENYGIEKKKEAKIGKKFDSGGIRRCYRN